MLRLDAGPAAGAEVWRRGGQMEHLLQEASPPSLVIEMLPTSSSLALFLLPEVGRPFFITSVLQRSLVSDLLSCSLEF